MPAYNWRFGATAAVTPRKRQCVNERLSPAETVVEAAAAPSRSDVMCKRTDNAVIDESNELDTEFMSL